MFKDLIYYFKYRIQDMQEKRKLRKEVKNMTELERLAAEQSSGGSYGNAYTGKNRGRSTPATSHKRYLFQKISVVIAALLWLFTAANVLWNTKGVAGQEKIISAFSSNMYTSMTAGISSFGKYGSIELTDNAKNIILTKVADEIGINKYNIVDTVEDGNAVKTLSQSGKNGDVICKFITVEEKAGTEAVSTDQYIYIGITLKNSVDSAFTYEKIVKKIMSEMEIDTIVTVNLKGEVSGQLTREAKDSITEQMLSMMDAKIQAENKTDDVYTVYAYDKSIDSYILIGSSKVNINISMSYDEEKNITDIYFSTPINNQDY